MVTYAKGRAVLAMAQAWLGPDAFRAGLRGYLQRHAWGNATADDLYAALAEASGGRDVAGVMRSFTDQTVVPLIEARVRCAPGAAPAVSLRQREYLTLDRAGAGDAGKLWRVPVCVGEDGGGRTRTLIKHCTVLGDREGVLALDAGAACPKLVYANAGEAGYYRVAMGPTELAAISAALAWLPEQERFGVVSNAWAAVLAGALPPTAFLDLCLRLQNDPSRLVWVENTL